MKHWHLSRRVTTFGLILIGAWLSSRGTVRANPPAKPVDYSRDIKPILSNSCYACHGPDAARRKAHLRLDQRTEAIKKAIKPGDAANSPLFERIASDDPDEQMPPATSKKERLKPEQVELIRRWIDQGAKFDLHWAFIRPTRPALPVVKNKSWPLNPVDYFIAAGQDAHGLTPSPEADRVTLVRRLSFDLTGLPPEPAVVNAYVNDTTAEADDKLVTRLLDSPHYGERMALYWLDLVRFADTGGYHSDNHRDVTLYRDYVIEAFNKNKPFDRFTIEQLAGDLLPHPTTEQKIASGYNRMLMTTEEGGAQAKEYLAKYAADRVRNTSVVWLAATMGCCECHDHKFDPYKTKDFYSFAAFFADLKELAVGRQEQTPMPTSEQDAKLHRLDEQIVSLRTALERQTPELAAGRAAWEKRVRAELAVQQPGWNTLKPTKVVSRGGATLTVQGDRSVLSSGKNPAKDIYTVTLATNQQRITGLRLEVLTHPSLANHGLSRDNGNFVLTGFEVEVSTRAKPQLQPVKIHAARADYEQDRFPIVHALDDDPNTGWAVDGHFKPANHAAVFVFAQPIAGGEGTTLTIRLKHESIYARHNIGRFRLSLTSVERPALPTVIVPDDVATALAVASEKRSAQQKTTLASYYRGIAPETKALRAQITKLEAEKNAVLKAVPTTLVSMAASPRVMRILPRGNWLDDSGEVVTPAVPAFLSTPKVHEGRATRLDLAQWMVARDNPLVARVIVNRLWMLVFGQGLVKTADDFGAQGEAPSHPELLDWLAVEFMDSGWDIKHMLRLMVTSRTYRQSSHAVKELRERDPANRLLARQGRFRIDAEMVRDNALAISGLLSRKIGGPSVKPYQPAGYWQYLNFPTREYYADHGSSQYRRGLYTYWQRTFPHPSLIAFDAPSREECTVERPRSSTPLQALVLLNDPTYVEAARVFAEHMIKQGGAGLAERLDWAYRRAVSRGVRPEEVKVLAEVYHKHHAEYTADRQAAQKLVSTGEWRVPLDIDVVELAAWTSVARVILNLHETITRN
jgi:hypothetical protein